MSIEFCCSQCGKLLRTGDETVGRQAQCPECGALSRVPSPGDAAGVTPLLEPLCAGSASPAGSPFGSGPASGDSDNPYQSPRAAGYTVLPSQPNPFAAQRVSSPATALIVTAILGLIAQVLGMIFNMISLAAGPAGRGQDAFPVVFGGGINLAFGAFGLVMGVLILIGAMKMKNLENYSFAVVSAFIAMIPCVSPCCLLGLPFGIWALVVLNDDSVKAAFRS